MFEINCVREIFGLMVISLCGLQDISICFRVKSKLSNLMTQSCWSTGNLWKFMLQATSKLILLENLNILDW